MTSAFTNFVCHLVSANSCFLVPSFRVLVRSLCPVEAVSEADFAHLATREGPVHETIRAILQLVPTGTTSLFEVLKQLYPHQRLGTPAHVAYLRHVLRVSDEVPALRERLLVLVMSRLIAIDVEIKLEELPDGDSDGDEDDEERLLFPIDDLGSDTATPQPSSAVTSTTTDVMAQKLDALMEELFGCVAGVGRGTESPTSLVLPCMCALLNVLTRLLCCPNRMPACVFLQVSEASHGCCSIIASRVRRRGTETTGTGLAHVQHTPSGI